MKSLLLVVVLIGVVSALDLSLYDTLACVTSPESPIIRQVDANIPTAFSTPGFNYSDATDTYPAGQICQWSISVDNGSALDVTFFNFSIELTTNCVEEYVQVYDGPDDTAPLIVTLCGLHEPTPFTATGNSLFVRFVSDADDTTLTGFIARVGYPLTVTACDGAPQEFTSPNGIFASENYPINYGPAKNCEYHFLAPAGQVIEISFENFEVEECCTCDYLAAHAGGGLLAPKVAHWFGVGLPCQIRSSGNELFLSFRSDVSVGGPGFLGRYSFV